MRILFTSDEQKILKADQSDVRMHPYTCPRGCKNRILAPAMAGWYCTCCDYEQPYGSREVQRMEFMKAKLPQPPKEQAMRDSPTASQEEQK